MAFAVVYLEGCVRNLEVDDVYCETFFSLVP